MFEAVGKRYVEATRVVSMPVIPRSPFAHYSVNVAHFPSRIDTFLAVMDRCCPVPCKVIVYTSNARQAEWLAARLRQDVDVDVVVLHGGMDSGAREASLVTFRVSDVSERSLLLVCSGSDLGPGHDPQSMLADLVVQYNLPAAPEYYVTRLDRGTHSTMQRIGCRRRVVVSLVESVNDERILREVEEMCGVTVNGLPEEWVV